MIFAIFSGHFDLACSLELNSVVSILYWSGLGPCDVVMLEMNFNS